MRSMIFFFFLLSTTPIFGQELEYETPVSKLIICPKGDDLRAEWEAVMMEKKVTVATCATVEDELLTLNAEKFSLFHSPELQKLRDELKEVETLFGQYEAVVIAFESPSPEMFKVLNDYDAIVKSARQAVRDEEKRISIRLTEIKYRMQELDMDASCARKQELQEKIQQINACRESQAPTLAVSR